MKQKLNRKDFLKGILYFMFLPLFLIVYRMLKDHQRFGSNDRILRIPNLIPLGLSIYEDVILSKSQTGLMIYSSKCTHLGCKINIIENGELICPCHGSKYNDKGEPIKGPSIKNLASLDFEIDSSNNELIIQLS